ncbi:MAG: cytidylate kinase-like family protein [Deltaproteobacteria bacterium]
METPQERKKYIPGSYAKARPSVTEMAERYLREWERTRMEERQPLSADTIPVTICLSRKIGVGALEIADLLGQKTGLPVVDRQIVEHIAAHADLREKTVELFDERYPGSMREFLALAFGEKAFIRSDYTRHLFESLCSLTGMGPSIIVGRGAHLLLPRERVLAARIICSRKYRVQRVARIMDEDESATERRLEQVDKEQRDFFRKVYGKKDASPYEFDMVLNCDFLNDPNAVAAIIQKAFEEKCASRPHKRG